MEYIITKIIGQLEEILDAKIQKFEQRLQTKLDLHDAMIKLILENLHDIKIQSQKETYNFRAKHSTSASQVFLKVDNNCSVCNLEIDEKNEEIETQCHHFYHENCLQKKIKQQIDMGFPAGRCVGKTSNHKLCYGKIRIQECRFKDEIKVINKNLNHQAMSLMGQFTTCPMHDCNYFFKLNPTLNPVNYCSKCDRYFCYNCYKICKFDHQCARITDQIICKFCNRCGELQLIPKMKPQFTCKHCNNMIFL